MKLKCSVCEKKDPPIISERFVVLGAIVEIVKDPAGVAHVRQVGIQIRCEACNSLGSIKSATAKVIPVHQFPPGIN